MDELIKVTKLQIEGLKEVANGRVKLYRKVVPLRRQTKYVWRVDGGSISPQVFTALKDKGLIIQKESLSLAQSSFPALLTNAGEKVCLELELYN